MKSALKVSHLAKRYGRYPTGGSIHYFGKDFFKNQSESLHYVTFASTYKSLPPDLTLEENLYVFGKLYGLSRAEINKESIPLFYFGMNLLLNVIYLTITLLLFHFSLSKSKKKGLARLD